MRLFMPSLFRCCLLVVFVLCVCCLASARHSGRGLPAPDVHALNVHSGCPQGTDLSAPCCGCGPLCPNSSTLYVACTSSIPRRLALGSGAGEQAAQQAL
jgi:hypothetical protein